MRILRLHLRHFRGFDDLTIKPQKHLVLMGEPGAGRSDLIEGLRRLLAPDSTRFPLSEPTDFHSGDLTVRVEIEAYLGDLEPEFQQLFMDHLEVWNEGTHELVPELDELDQLQDPAHQWVIRLCYRARWDAVEKQGEHWIDYPKTSDPDNEVFDRVPRPVRERIPFALVEPATRPLDLGPRSPFRKVIEAADGTDFPAALEDLNQGLKDLAARLSQGEQVSNALARVLESISMLMEVSGAPVGDVIRFLPEGGALGAIIRSLGPAVDLLDGVGPLPLNRHGSTMQALLAISEAMWAAGSRSGIVVADDFGEGLDAASAHHLAATLRKTCGQVWLSTRRSSAAEPFGPEELVRLTKSGRTRRALHGEVPVSKADRLAARHFHLQLLPAAASRSLIVVEGPHDRSALEAIARRLFLADLDVLPAAQGIAIIHAGAADEAGGSTVVPRLALAAKRLGFRVVAVLDWDRDQAQAQIALNMALAASDAVVRLPEGAAIEVALLADLADDTIRTATQEVANAFGVPLPGNIGQLTGDDLRAAAITFLKSSAGFHAQFVDALPDGVLPPLATQLLRTAVLAARGGHDGHVQL
jgi:putative ATP-dependent endonuclease of the OLD family